MGTMTVPLLLESLKQDIFAGSTIAKHPLIWMQGHTSGIQQTGIWNSPEFLLYVEKYFKIISWTHLNQEPDLPKFKNSKKEQPIVILEGLFEVKSSFQLATNMLNKVIQNARAVILIGNEASYGTFRQDYHFKLVEDLILNTKTPFIRLPGTPVPLRHLLGTLNHLYLYGIPERDEYQRPQMFYSKTLCESCEYQGDLEKGNFVQFFGEREGCLYLLGCKGRVTKNSCALDHWNETSSWCVKVGSPCSGCSQPDYPKHAGLGMYGQLSSGNSKIRDPIIQNTKAIAKGVFALTTATVAVHAMSQKSGSTLEEQELDAFYSEEDNS